MCQLINHIECRRWYSNIPCPIGQPHNMRALQIRISPKPFLQPSMIDRIIHGTRKEMQLYRHTIQRSFKMMKPYIILQFEMTLSIFCYLFPACIHPYINISRSAGIRIRIHQCIPPALSGHSTSPHPSSALRRAYSQLYSLSYSVCESVAP